MFRKILIANRGEIAVRVIRACRELKISPVAIYSDADHDALHVRLSDEAHHIGPAPSSSSYLDFDKVLDAARKSEVEAIHPGYGFLSENYEFARACQDAGFQFIGPSVNSIKLISDKLASRAAVLQAGVPVVPGTDGPLESLKSGLKLASQIGYPVMLKASAGGGGKGMRLLRSEEEFRLVYETTKNEAQAAFGDATVYLEKYLTRPRHIEIQVLGDLEGNLIYLGERECSIQRRHQKLLEESPSPMVNSHLRHQLGEAAIAVAKVAQYHNAGTVEFIVDVADSENAPAFYFLEMNTRLQVEHAVTELVTGVDLVRQQVQIAAGHQIGYEQQDIQIKGCAIECRIYAEDPESNFMPSPGEITTYVEPSGPGIRCDSGVDSGSSVPLEYDPLLLKLLAYDQDRMHAIARMRRALSELKIGGVNTTIPLFETLLSHPSFLEGHVHTQFIEEQQLTKKIQGGINEEDLTPIIAAAMHHFLRKQNFFSTVSSRKSSWRKSEYFPNEFHSR